MKVRCEFSNPLAESCKKCASAKVECQSQSETNITDKNTISKKSKAKSRIDYLQKYITEAYNEIASIQKEEGTEEGDSSSKIDENPSSPHSPSYQYPDDEKLATGDNFTEFVIDPDDDGGLTLTSNALRSNDVVKTAIELNLYTYEEAVRFYEIFNNDMYRHIPCDLKAHKNLDSMCVTRSILALAMITSAASVTTWDKATVRRAFFERIVTERINIMGKVSISLIHSLIIDCMFLSTARSFLWLLWAYVVAVVMDLGSATDLANIKKLPADHPERIRSIESSEAVLAMTSWIALMGLTGARKRRWNILGGWQNLCDTMRNFTRDSPMHNRYLQLIIHIESSFDIKRFVEKVSLIPQSSVTDALDIYHQTIAKVNVQEKLYLNLSEGDVDRKNSWENSLFFAFSQMKYILTDTILDRYLANGLKIQPSGLSAWANTALESLVYELEGFLIFQIEDFIKDVKSSARVPKYVFIRPIQTMVCLTRVRAVREHIGMKTEVPPETEILKLFDDIEQVWSVPEKTSWQAHEIFPFLKKVKSWYLNVRERAAQRAPEIQNVNQLMKQDDDALSLMKINHDNVTHWAAELDFMIQSANDALGNFSYANLYPSMEA